MKRIYICQWTSCFKEYSDLKSFILHAQEPHEPKLKVRCRYGCELEFNSIDAMQMHARLMHRHPLQIKTAQKQLMSPTSPTSPIPIKKIGCHWEDCEEVFENVDEYIIHANQKHMQEDEKNLVASMGRVKFKYEVNESIKCQWYGCEKEFGQLKKCMDHVQWHHLTSETDLKCKWGKCPARPTTKSNLVSHLSKHIPLIREICFLCNKRFKWLSDYKKHCKHHHSIKERDFNDILVRLYFEKQRTNL